MCVLLAGVARLPLVNGFARTPPVLWQMQWAPQWEAPVPPPPADWLLDRDLLHEYIYRANLLGEAAPPGSSGCSFLRATFLRKEGGVSLFLK